MRDISYPRDDNETVKRNSTDRRFNSNIEEPLLSKYKGSLKNSKLTVPLYRSSQLTTKKYVPRYSVKIHCQDCDFYGYSHVDERKNLYIRRFTVFGMFSTVLLFVTGVLFINFGYDLGVQILLYANLGMLVIALIVFALMVYKYGHRMDHFCMKCGKKF
jgi:hypothetical protein